MVITDMRYMWSEIDSPLLMSKRRHPSRFVVFSRSRRWKKGTGEEEFSSMGKGKVDSTKVLLVAVSRLCLAGCTDRTGGSRKNRRGFQSPY